MGEVAPLTRCPPMGAGASGSPRVAFLLLIVIPTLFRDRKLSTSSTGNMKSKWVNAFKNIKGKQEAG